MFGEKKIPEGNIRPYDAYTMGNNYRPVEMTNAFVRSQLKRLNEYNQKRIENANYLTQELSKIESIIPPYVPEDRTHTYHIYRIKLDPEKVGYGDMKPQDFRWAVQNSLFAEGVPVMEWHSFPVPGQKIFQRKDAYGKGCPWSCQFARKEIRYEPNDYPETQKMFDASFVLYTIYPSNSIELMKYYVEAFHKVFHQLDRVVSDAEYYKPVRAKLE